MRYWLCPSLIERPFVEQASKPLLRLLCSQHSKHQVLGATPEWIVLGLVGRGLQAANFLELRACEVRRILFLRTTVNKGKKGEGPSTMGFVQTTYLGIGYGLKLCYGVAWVPGLGICFLF